ncbi:MAG: Gfo/Idh/MocA family protein [Eubacteriales bacterium]
MKSVRFGIIGIGNMGSAHAVSLRDGKIGDAVLTAVCDISSQRLEWAASTLPGVRTFLDSRDLMESGTVDAVIIATPHYFHPPMAIEGFRHGLHVMTEKPAGVRVSDVEQMIAAADATDRKFGIMFNQRTNPLFQKARELVQSGRLGIPKRLTWIITNWYRTQSYYDSGSWRGTFCGEGGGVLLNQAPHNLDLLQWIFGMPKSIFAICSEGLYHHVEVEDRATLILDYENGAQAQFMTTTGEYPGTNRLEITGDRGKLTLEGGKLTLWESGFSEREYCFSTEESSCEIPCTVTEFCPDTPETAHNGVLNAFVGAILRNEPLIADGREGIRMLTLTDAAYLSSWTGRKIELSGDGRLQPSDSDCFNRLLREKQEKSALRPAVISNADGTVSPRWKVTW